MTAITDAMDGANNSLVVTNTVGQLDKALATVCRDFSKIADLSVFIKTRGQSDQPLPVETHSLHDLPH